MATHTWDVHVFAATFAAFLITMDGANIQAGEKDQQMGVLNVHATRKDSDGAVRPLGGVELELECDREAGHTRTDANGRATVRAHYSSCKLTAKTSVADGGRQCLWSSDVVFSHKDARVDFSDDNASCSPVLIRDVDAERLAELRRTGADSQLVIRTVVRRNGTVGTVSVVSGAPSHEFEASVIAAFRRRKYEPALKNGWPVEVYFMESLDFGPPFESASLTRGGEPITAADDLVLPVIVTRVVPRYPDLMLRARVEGKVVLQAVIDEKGNVIDVSVLSSSNPEFDYYAIEALEQRKYRPALKEGKPVRIYVTIKTDFRLR